MGHLIGIFRQKQNCKRQLVSYAFVEDYRFSDVFMTLSYAMWIYYTYYENIQDTNLSFIPTTSYKAVVIVLYVY